MNRLRALILLPSAALVRPDCIHRDVYLDPELF